MPDQEEDIEEEVILMDYEEVEQDEDIGHWFDDPVDEYILISSDDECN